MKNQHAVMLGIGLILLLVLGYFLFPSAPEPEPAVVVAPIVKAQEEWEPVQREQEPADTKTVVPKRELLPVASSIAASQSAIVKVVGQLSPKLVQWLVSDEQLRKWVILIDQLADGDLSPKFPPVAYPMANFEVLGSKDDARISPKNYTRATALVKSVTAIDPELLVAYYRQWQPLLEKAYAELGKSGKFEDRVVLAIRNVQAVPAAPIGAQLIARPVMYKFVDAKFEKAPNLHKWMWRLGPNNQAEIKAYLTKVKLALYKQP